MIKVAIMQPYIFPYIGYFQLIHAVDLFVVLDDVNYIKKGWINRNRILSNNEALTFTVPLKKASQNKLIKDLDLHTDYPSWRDKFLKTLQFSYKKAANFEPTYDLIRQCLPREETSISKLCVRSLKLICGYLRINTQFIDSSSKLDTGGLTGEDRILKICKLCFANNYINLSGGKDLYSYANFEKIGMSLSFISSKPISYPQLSEPHIPWLSIIDILMFNDINTVRRMLENVNLESNEAKE